MMNKMLMKAAAKKMVKDAQHHGEHHEHHDVHHEHHREHHHHEGRRRGWFKGFVYGGLIGLGLSLLYAPQSGRNTREMLRYKATQFQGLAEQKADEMRDKVEQGRSDLRLQTSNLRQTAREKVAEQKERLTRVASSVKQAAAESWHQGSNGGQGAAEPEAQTESTRPY
jgi:gas vesicle protein